MNPLNFILPPQEPEPEPPAPLVIVENLNGFCVVKIFDTPAREKLLLHFFMPWDAAEILAGRILDALPAPEWPKEI